MLVTTAAVLSREIEGRAATDHGDPGYAGSARPWGVARPGLREDDAHAAAGRQGADPRRPRRHHQHATHMIPGRSRDRTAPHVRRGLLNDGVRPPHSVRGMHAP